jgi:hypothetical protein
MFNQKSHFYPLFITHKVGKTYYKKHCNEPQNSIFTTIHPIEYQHSTSKRLPQHPASSPTANRKTRLGSLH